MLKAQVKLTTFFLGLMLCVFLKMNVAFADVEIQVYKKKYSWKREWTLKIFDELNKEQYHLDHNSLLNVEINKESLSILDCSGYNEASLDEKKDFWVVFFSALTRAESAFNEKAKSIILKGHRSWGLLQLAKKTAKAQCSMNPPQSSVLNGNDNLYCGIRLMTWQLQGGPLPSGKKIRPDLVGKIFGKKMFQWGPLRQNDFHGRALLVNWFKDHLNQLKFCKKSNEA